jgi:DNA-binding MarR family transcriptional regulator
VNGEQKITSFHRERLAVVYLRQSSMAQVREHAESTMRQYGLADEAVRLGWARPDVQVIDTDLGISGRFGVAREGFRDLVSTVCRGEVGAIFGIEISRLARSNADVARLMEFARITDTLLIDADGIYDPAHAPGPGRCGRSHHQFRTPGRPDARRGRGRLAGAGLGDDDRASRLRAGQPGKLVGPGRMRHRGAGPRPARDVPSGPGHGPAHRRETQPRVPGRTHAMTPSSAGRDRAAAREAWQAMSELVLDNERRRAVSEQTGLSFGKLRALRRIASQPRPMGELAALLGVDPPNLTPLIDDLERSGLVERQPHPTDRRVKLVAATDSGRALAQQVQELLDQPPPGLLDLPGDDLDNLRRILSQLRPAIH